MSDIPEFTDIELWAARTTLKERYNKEFPLDLVETELRLSPGARDLTTCPAIFWEKDKTHFILTKTGESAYRCQFFYRLHQMYGTGQEEYDDLTVCMVSLLQVEADHNASDRPAS